MFDLRLFIGKDFFIDGGAQNYLIFNPIYNVWEG